MVLLTGNAGQVKAWARSQHSEAVSCREVFQGRSPASAQAFTRVGLHIVHRALEDFRPYAVEGAWPYLSTYLHEAVITAPLSLWVAHEDDVRDVVALELAQRLRNALTHGIIAVRRRGADFNEGLGDSLRRLSAPKRSAKVRPKISPDLVTYISSRVLADLAEESEHDTYLSKLERLRIGFGLSQHELAQLLNVSPEAIRKWIRGGGISPELRGTIDLNLALLDRLESYVRPGLLPAVVRRPARGLRGNRLTALLLRGEGQSIVDYLENLTSYASTA